MNIALFAITLTVLIVSTYTDIREGKVLNEIVLPAIGIGLILQIFNLSFIDYLIRLVLVAAIFFFYEGFIGGGDAKLFMMLIITQGPAKSFITVGFAALAVVIMYFIKSPKEATESFKAQAMAILTKTTDNIKGAGKTVKFVPLMLAGYVITLLIMGI